MIRAFGAIGATLDQGTRKFVPLVLSNLITMVLSIPLVAVAYLAGVVTGSPGVFLTSMVLLIVILPNPAASGLHYIAHGFATSVPLMGAGDLPDGLRRYGALALRAWLVGIAGIAVIAGNLAFYTTLPGPIFAILRLVWLYALYIWVTAHLYVYPLIIEQQVKRVLLIYRNAIVMSVTRPIFTLVAAAAWILVGVLVSATGLAAVFGLGFASLLQQNATARAIATFEERAPAE